MHRPGTGDYPNEPLRLWKYLWSTIDVGPTMTAKILQNNGKVVYWSTYWPLTVQERANNTVQQDMVTIRETTEESLGARLTHAPIMPITPSNIPVHPPNGPQQSPWLQQTIITQDDDDNPMAINFIQHQVWHNPLEHLPFRKIEGTPSFEHYFSSPVIHPQKDETITSYERLATDPLTKGKLIKAMTMELDKISHGHIATNTLGTKIFIFLDHDAIKTIPTDKKNRWYAHIVVGYRLQKPDPNRVGGIIIKYPNEVTT